MELVEEDRLPEALQRGLGVGDTVPAREDGQNFEIVEGLFGQAIVAFVLGHRGQCAAVIFEIEFADPAREGFWLTVHAGDKALEIGRHGFVADLWAAWNAALHAANIFEHAPGRAAAAIAMAIDEEKFVVEALLAEAFPSAHDVAGDKIGAIGGVDPIIFVALGGEEIGRDPGAIQTLPEEDFVRHAVGVVPAHLVGDEDV